MRRLPGELYQMKNEPLDHAIRVLSQMDIDLHRISIDASEAQAGLIADCCEHRLAMLTKLRHVKMQNQAHEEQSFKAGDFNGGDINEEDDSTYFFRVAAQHSNAHAAYRRKMNRIALILGAISLGIILAVVKILTDLF